MGIKCWLIHKWYYLAFVVFIWSHRIWDSKVKRIYEILILGKFVYFCNRKFHDGERFARSLGRAGWKKKIYYIWFHMGVKIAFHFLGMCWGKGGGCLCLLHRKSFPSADFKLFNLINSVRFFFLIVVVEIFPMLRVVGLVK